MINLKTEADYYEAIATLPSPCMISKDLAQARQLQLTKPPGALGRLEEIALWMASWQKNERPQLTSPACLIFAGNHGVAQLGVSAFPSEVTAQMVGNFAAGGAAINQLTAVAGASLDVIALDLDNPTTDFTTAPAMSIEETIDAMTKGANAIPDNTDMLLLGEMGIGNTTVAAALAYACFRGKAEDWVGSGTGVNADGIKLKADVITKAISLHQNTLTSGLEILSALGGRELAAIAGAILAARHRRIPVLLDGFIATASTLPLFTDNPTILDHVLISHCSQENGHRHILEQINKTALIDLDLRLGEASGAAIALPIIRAAIATHSNMATFAEAGVTDKTET